MTKDRVEAFSDAVIAIVMTVMVLELRAPASADPVALRPLIPVFLSYTVSLDFLGIYWTNHHHAAPLDGERALPLVRRPTFKFVQHWILRRAHPDFKCPFREQAGRGAPHDPKWGGRTGAASGLSSRIQALKEGGQNVPLLALAHDLTHTAVDTRLFFVPAFDADTTSGGRVHDHSRR